VEVPQKWQSIRQRFPNWGIVCFVLWLASQVVLWTGVFIPWFTNVQGYLAGLPEGQRTSSVYWLQGYGAGMVATIVVWPAVTCLVLWLVRHASILPGGGSVGPFTWILVTPVFTTPLSLVIARALPCSAAPVGVPANYDLCPIWTVPATFAPGLLNLAALLWLRADCAWVRRNAVIAASLGAARFMLPVVNSLRSIDPTVLPAGVLISSSFPFTEASYIGVLLWVLSGIVGVFAVSTELPPADDPPTTGSS
jgi:hypothetical protein